MTNDIDTDVDKKKQLDLLRKLGDGQFIASVSRVGPTVYFGPFSSVEELAEFCDKHGISVGVIRLTDPNSDPETWWGPRDR